MLNTATKAIPPFKPGAGMGKDNINNVITGAIKDNSHAYIWENQSDNAVPAASLRIRTLAIFIDQKI